MKRTMLAGLLLGPVSVLLSSGISSKPRQLNAQAVAPAPSGANAAWTLKVKGDIRWQQVTPMGALLVSTDAALAAVDIERGQVMWEKPEPGANRYPPRSAAERQPSRPWATPGRAFGRCALRSRDGRTALDERIAF